MDNYIQQISQGIKRLREDRKLTQEVFAEKVNLSVNGLRNIDKGRYQLTAATLDCICKIFNVSVIDLLTPNLSNTQKELINLIQMKLLECSPVELTKIAMIVDIIK